jgi:sialate O-acetylesterase
MNTIAVRVYDGGDEGGIVDGDVGIYSREDAVRFVTDLSGKWYFRTGDDPAWAFPSVLDKEWDKVQVPDRWENQGYSRYDGIAWYKKYVKITAEQKSQKLILLLGKINDIDEVYFNGERIGGMGRFPSKKRKAKTSGYYKKRRAYFIPSNLIKTGQENIIAVRVFDDGKNGGIYEDPVGIVTRQEYLRYSK